MIEIGKQYGYWTVVRETEKRSKDRSKIWWCKCKCGNHKEVKTKILSNILKPRSCGCVRKEKSMLIYENHIIKTNTCWFWSGTKNNCGYGKQGKKKTAHRIAYEKEYGTIPKLMQVCHTCDNKLCVNPHHLFLGTIAENMRDKVKKGRQAKGSKIGSSILNEQIVLDIRRQRLNGKTYKELADKYNLKWDTIRRACKGPHWKHVDLWQECQDYISPAGGYPYRRLR